MMKAMYFNYPLKRTFIPRPNKERIDKELWELFSKMKINIPLIEAIRKIPRYVKFLKDLCTNKMRGSGHEHVSFSEIVTAVLQRKAQLKCRDPGTLPFHA